MPLRSRGTDPEVRRFSTALRRVDEAAFADFVADLWEARGRSVTRDGTTLAVESSGGGRRIRVTHGAPSSARDGQVAEVVTSRVVESAADGAESAVVDAAELLCVVRYAVGRDRAAALLERHLGAGAATFAEPGAVRAERERSRTRRRRLGRRLVAAVVVAACLGGVALAGPGLVSSLNAPPFGVAEESPTPTEGATEPATARDEPAASSPADRLDYAALGCPSPPGDADPAELAPAVVPGASASGLDGWRLVDSESVESFDDRIRLGSPPEPTARHVARYVPPSGEMFRLTIDRWRSVGAANAVEWSLADANATALRWGEYTVVVRAFAADGTRLSEAQTLDRSRVLLAAVHGPDGDRLGFECVGSLLDEANETGETDGARDGNDPPAASAATA